MHDQLFDFLKVNKKVTCNQSAVQKLCSTVTSLISSMDSRKINLTIILEGIKKAYNTVDHSVLIKSFAHMVTEDRSTVDLFESY